MSCSFFVAARRLSLRRCSLAPHRRRSVACADRRVRSDQLRPERADRGARRCSRSTIRSPSLAEPGADADQSGEQSREPALFVAAASSRPSIQQDPAAARPGPAHRLSTSSRSNTPSRRPMVRRRPAPPSSATDRRRRRQRWQNSVAAFQDALRVQAGVVGNHLDQRLRHVVADLRRASPRPARCRRRRPAISCSRCNAAARRSRRPGRGARPRPSLEQSRSTAAAQEQAREQCGASRRASGYQPGNVTMFHGN